MMLLTLQNETLSYPLHYSTKKGQNSARKQKSASAYCWVVYSSSKSWYKSYWCYFNSKSMFTMC